MEEIRKHIERKRFKVEPSEEPYLYKSIMDNYRTKRLSCINDKSFFIQGQAKDSKGAVSNVVNFSDEEAKRLYYTCFEWPLGELVCRFKNTAANTAVVLTGGTFANRHLLEKAKKKISDGGLQYLEYVETHTVHGHR